MKSSHNAKIILSRDGSHTLEIEEMDETYHSRHGAITESEYVFIDEGLDKVEKEHIQLLEIGLGTGLNALLTATKAKEKKKQVHYHSIEAYPLTQEIALKLNYPKGREQEKIFEELHTCEWEKEVAITPHFHLTKKLGKMEELTFEDSLYDLVYYDAFAPSRQPEMWIPERLEQVLHSMKSGGLFVTYCAQGQFKRDMRSLGFEIESLEGPPGKAEMIRAVKP